MLKMIFSVTCSHSFSLVLTLAVLFSLNASLAQIHHDENTEHFVIVKIGGSSITDKGQFETLNETSLTWFAQTIKESTLSNNRKIIIVHGAGSFGHYHAKQFGLSSVSNPGKKEESTEMLPDFNERLKEGVSKTRLSVQTLHLKLISALIQQNINAIGISPFSVSPVYDNDLDLNLLSASVTHAVNRGMVPVIHGDVVFESDIGAAILGGDDIVTGIASHFVQVASASKINSCHENNAQVEVVFITDVDGVFTSDPKENKNAELVPLLEVSNHGGLMQMKGEEVIHASKSSHEHDVTGGLQSKLKSAIEIAKQSVKVSIVKCGSINALQAIKGDKFDVGTTITLRMKKEIQ